MLSNQRRALIALILSEKNGKPMFLDKRGALLLQEH
jgi:hypothetical protein